MSATLSADQAKFFELVASYPRFSGVWNAEKCRCDIDRFSRLLRGGVLSRGEIVILKVLYSIWCNRASDDTEIDITELAVVDAKNREPILRWIANPFWP